MYGQTVTHDHRHDDEHDTTAGVTGRRRDRPADQRPARGRHRSRGATRRRGSRHIRPHSRHGAWGTRTGPAKVTPKRPATGAEMPTRMRQSGRHARLPPGGVAEQRRQPPVKRPPSDALVQVQPPPPTRISRNGQRAGLLLRSSGFDPLEAYRRGTRQGGGQTHGLVGEWSPRRPVKAKTASSNLVGAATWRAWARGEPTRFERGRPATRPGSSTLPPSATSVPMERYPRWTRGRPGKAVGGLCPCVGSSPTPSAVIPTGVGRSEEAIRLVEEPGLNPGGPSGLRAFEPPRFRAASLST